ncbi:tripartite tricarboxylate transporter substrate-binding protein [Sediminicoccus sp. KRV36]|uniref:Bug family tripartite tricarboxylate transporter substrate binding protein n=1 Tax=Sediminicoccus sp. KRV36 TaxID=3133721 RepID=UPI00200EFC44|nr:tripartite tricarboxylate transporter substrate-binding protein [Sediminicoccus rosea]UPY37485.1 tripartite tricarboxylate transporter substrate binding protein [Sediminicoccus rosea]
MIRHLALVASCLLAALSPLAAQSFPQRPITLAVGFAPGGSTDIVSRLISERFGANLGPEARVVVENRPGASGIVAGDWLRRQAPDGHTLMLIEVSSHAIAPAALVGGTPFDPLADFTQIAMIGTAPMILIASPSFPAANAQEAVARLRASRPEEFAYATSGVGSIPHLGVEMLAAQLGARFTHVPYRSGGLMLTAIHQGEGQFGIAVLASAAGQVRGGLVRGLAVTSRERFPSFPEIPTLNEAAMPGFELTTWNMIIGPPNMPPAVLAQLNRALLGAVADAPLRERLLQAGVLPWAGENTPETTRAFLTAEVQKYREVVARTGIRLER